MSFMTDAWMSPNHKAYIAVTVHFNQDGIPICLLLDIVEVAHFHSGFNLAKAFVAILEDFGIADKVSESLMWQTNGHLLIHPLIHPDLVHHL